MKRKIGVTIFIVLLVAVIIYFAFPGVLYNLNINFERKLAGLKEKSIDVMPR